MALNLSAARQDLLSSLDAYRSALDSSNAVGSGNAAGSACAVGDADAPAGDAASSQPAQEDDPRNTASTTQSDELQEMLRLMKMFMDALIQQNQQNQANESDDGFSPVSSPSGSGGAPGIQPPAQASATPQPDDTGGAPATGGGAAPAGGLPDAAAPGPVAGSAGPAAAAASTPASGPAAADSASSGGGLSSAAQTTALTEGESEKVAGQWKQSLQKDFGLTNDQAAGVVGNLWHESAGMNSGITQGGKIGEPNANMADDNGNGYGIAQWGGSRKQGLMDFAQKNGLPASSQAANYGYLKQELSGSYASAIDAVKGTSDVASATAAFANAFEKPSDPQMASRVADAEKVA